MIALRLTLAIVVVFLSLGAYAAPTLDLRIIILKGSGWSEAEAMAEWEKAHDLLAESCGIELKLSELVQVEVAPEYLDLALDDDVEKERRVPYGQTQLAAQFGKTRAVRVFLFRSIKGQALGPYTTDLASVASEVGKSHPTANDIWMAIAHPNPPLAPHPAQSRLGHELGHVLLNQASHEEPGRNNFMSGDSSQRDDSVLPIQCLLMKQSPLVNH